MLKKVSILKLAVIATTSSLEMSLNFAKCKQSADKKVNKLMLPKRILALPTLGNALIQSDSSFVSMITG